MTRAPGRSLLWAVVVSFAAGAAHAQPPASPAPLEKPKNLQILPKDMSREQVIDVMKAFTSALGVRCQHCHVAKDPADFSTFDFASDEKENKKVARVMMTMTGEINDRLMPQIGRTPLLRVLCVTCHRGLARPEPLAEVLAATAKKSGAEAAVQQYKELREKHGASGGYDFSARSLGAVAQRLAAGGDVAGAITLQELSLSVLPPTAQGHATLADLHLKKGDRSAARAQLEKALVLQPQDAGLQKRLKELADTPR